MDYVQVSANKVPWVFWISIKWRKTNWFKCFWKTRGSNAFEFVAFYRITVNIGMPWLQSVVNQNLQDYGNLKRIENRNNQNLKAPRSLFINPNRKLL